MAETEAPRKSNALLIFGIIFGLLFLCCVCCSSIFGLFGYIKDPNGGCIYEGPMYDGYECDTYDYLYDDYDYNYDDYTYDDYDYNYDY